MKVDSCLLIGGAGFIGRHVVKGLVQRGKRVTVLGRSISLNISLPNDIAYVCGDYRNHHLIQQLVSEHDAIIYLPSWTKPGVDIATSVQYIMDHLPHTIQLFSEIAKKGRRLLLLSSGGTVYGNVTNTPITELEPTIPISAYGISKLTLERFAHFFHLKDGLDVICVRPANAYGEGQLPFVGQGFIATAVASGILNIPVRVFGQRGTIRDYIYVEDLVNGILELLFTSAPGETYNIGTGCGMDNIEVLAKIKKVLRQVDLDLKLIHEPQRISDVRKNILDSSKLRGLTGWRCEVSFTEGLIRTFDWLQSHLESNREQY